MAALASDPVPSITGDIAVVVVVVITVVLVVALVVALVVPVAEVVVLVLVVLVVVTVTVLVDVLTLQKPQRRSQWPAFEHVGQKRYWQRSSQSSPRSRQERPW